MSNNPRHVSSKNFCLGILSRCLGARVLLCLGGLFLYLGRVSVCLGRTYPLSWRCYLMSWKSPGINVKRSTTDRGNNNLSNKYKAEFAKIAWKIYIFGREIRYAYEIHNTSTKDLTLTP